AWKKRCVQEKIKTFRGVCCPIPRMSQSHPIEEEAARQDYIDNVFIEVRPGHPQYTAEEERLEDYGRCSKCNEIRTGIDKYKWCKSCNATHFRQGFSTWTSGYAEIDYFIQNAQIHACYHKLVLEWYPWEKFSDIEKIGEGGYGTVFRAKNNMGRILEWDQQNNKWLRFEIDEYVALKTIGHSESPSKEFLNEAKRLQRWDYQSHNYTAFYGFTKNETTGQYLLVLRYFEGDLRKQLQRQSITWEEKLEMIHAISRDMKDIHQTRMIHRDLHPGNVLYSGHCQIGDLGLSVLESEADEIKDIMGVMPYVAPEILCGRSSYSQGTDVYAFGIIMWEISSQKKPYHQFKHDINLALQICKGLRPEITNDTPPFYQDLIEKCWHTDLTKRPTAKEIYNLTHMWHKNPTLTIRDQINKANEIRQQNIGKKEETQTHPGAFYTSRLLTNITNELASMISKFPDDAFDWLIDDK
ncbi:7434_t:CDS:2, partial [Ambispora gerdemannii]